MRINPAHRRLATLCVAAVILVAFVIAGVTARVPYVALSPGPTVNTLGTLDGKPDGEPVVEVTGAVDPHPSGHLNLTTVSLHDGLTLFDAIGMWFSSDHELQPRQLYFPDGKTTEEVNRETKQQMTSSEDNAIGAALSYLKRPIAVAAGIVSEPGPAAGILERGDVITAIDGTAVTSPQQVQDLIRAHKGGEKVTLELLRDGEPKTVEVTLGSRPDNPEQGFLGVTPKLVSGDPEVQITFNTGAIGGPSAGLMLTLAIVDFLTPESLAGDRFIAGTGTIDTEGAVGPIGGITHKLKAADDEGAVAFLVPADNCAEALTDAPDGLELIKVATLTEAVDALGALETGAPRQHC